MNREEIEAYGLASIGAVQGAWRYYVRPELTAKRAWMALGVAVTAYELACPEGETLSEGVDRLLEKNKLWALPIGYTALHLVNVLPEKIDFFHKVTELRH